MLRKKFPHFQQLDAMDCGPTCLKMIAKFYGRDYSIQYLRQQSYIDRQGTSLLAISELAEKLGFHTLGALATFETLVDEAGLPCIVQWRQNHFVIVYRIKKDKIYVADPASGLVTYSKSEFCKNWFNSTLQTEPAGIVLILEPTPDFYTHESEDKLPKGSFSYIFQYLKPYNRYVIQLFLGLLAGSLIALSLPFLTQSLVDFGINYQDMGFIYTILLAQLMIFVGKTSLDIIRSWILLHLSTRINISIISNFLAKLMRLPIAFFDSKNLGDILQRIRDHDRIELFLTSTSLELIFSLFNVLIFSLVLAFYDWKILSVFLLGSVFYLVWIGFFLRKRRLLDYKKFAQLAQNQSAEIQLITGMQEIKLYNSEKQKRWEWERIQAQLYKTNLKSLALSQTQNTGALFINELKNILITFIAAQAVINGTMTLGMMLAVSFILGQLNGPLLQLITFILQAQDAKISLERLGEVHLLDNEDVEDRQESFVIPQQADIILDNISFRYNNPYQDWILKDIQLTIPYGQTTAIVGASGSGKTTLLKLILKYYAPEKGEINLGKTHLSHLNTRIWREQCGAVMQDGFIFSDTIARNIALGEDLIDKVKLLEAAEIANLREFVENLPLNYNTKIGLEGIGLSEGQKQRILIARAIYKNPEYLFFDEATSALDANNEKAITEKLGFFTQNKTVLVIAHRLSTVKNAQQIVVLDKGEIKEIGTHQELVNQRGLYFELIKNQLELGS
jgi:ATP-binding cassette subfamily B protein